MRYENLDCKSSNKANHFLCDNVSFNATTGKFGSQAILDGMVVSKDGYQITGQKFKNSNSPLMLHSEIGAKGSKNMLIHRDLYFSVFHQLFHVGRNDSRFFELVYDDYPYYRIYKVK